MNLVSAVILPLHMLAGLAWLAAAVVVSMNAGKGGEKLFAPQMGAALVAFVSGGYLWHVFYGAQFGPAQKVLTAGVLAAIVAAGVQGALIGRAKRALTKGTLAEQPARARIALAHQIAAGFLIVTALCMVMARQV
jgi:hypothetical protein